MIRLVALLAATGLIATAELSDDDVRRLATAPFDKGAKMGRHDVLGIHHGLKLVADYPCSDVCPTYTTRVIHYDVVAGPTCEQAGGTTQARMVPTGIAVAKRDFCVPAILAERK